jgi:hypothetical protein
LRRAQGLAVAKCGKKVAPKTRVTRKAIKFNGLGLVVEHLPTKPDKSAADDRPDPEKPKLL